MAAYRTTPHDTTEKTPAFLLMEEQSYHNYHNQCMATKKPRERDQAMKLKSKQYADAKRNAKTSDVKPNDMVLLRQEKKNKLSATFATQLCKVQDKKGNQVIISDRKNPERVFHRNTTEVKRYHSSDVQTSSIKA